MHMGMQYHPPQFQLAAEQTYRAGVITVIALGTYCRRNCDIARQPLQFKN